MAGVGCGHLRASHADREYVVNTLKAAFVQGRLTTDELVMRVGQAFASRTYADLAALTTDIPAGPIGAQPVRKAARAQARAQARPSASTDVRTGVRVIIAATMLGAPLWAVALFTPAESYGMHPGLDYFMTWVVFVLTVGATITFALGSVLTGVSVLASRHQKRSGGQLPPRPMQGSQALEGEQDGRPGDDRILCDAPRDARARHMPDHRGAQRTWRSLTVRRDQHRPANLQVTADA